MKASDRASIVGRFRAAGFPTPEEEAADLVGAAGSPDELEAMVVRRLTGEPVQWILGRTEFLGLTLGIDTGVYVPRWQTGPVAAHALTHLPPGGIAVDLCTGSGAVAAFLAHHRPGARVVGTDLDPRAVRCARHNGVDAHVGSLFGPLPAELAGRVDVVVAVAPYVPDRSLVLLPRDVLAHEPRLALDGGADGLRVIGQIIDSCPMWLRDGGSLVLESGIDQVPVVQQSLTGTGLVLETVIHDGDGDPCGVCASTVVSGS